MEKVRLFNKIYSNCIRQGFLRVSFLKMCTTSSAQINPSDSCSEGERLEKLFASHLVQNMLQAMTGVDVDKIFKSRQFQEGKMKKAQYKFMTDEEYQEALRRANQKARKLLLMPPFVNPKSEKPNVISKDPEIQGFLKTKLVCVDISPGFTYKNRLIVVREPDGVLREANRTERILTNQVYFPRPQREITMPTFFQTEHLKNILERGEISYVLERACIQFEPEDPEYHRVVQTTYKHVDFTREFDKLRSTRFFGPMAFHLTKEKCIDNLLTDMIKRLLVDDATNLVKLYYMIHKRDKNITIQDDASMEEKIKFMKGYALEESRNSGSLEMVLQAVLDLALRERAVG